MLVIRVVVVSMLCTSSTAMTCSAAVAFVSSFDASCPMQCSNEGENNLAKCNPGQPERGLSSCGMEKCGAWVASMDDAKLESAMEGLKACASEPGMEQFAAYADMGVDYLKMAVMNIANECGHGDKLAMDKPAANTCIGAVTLMQGTDKGCPRQCQTDDDDDSSLPKCEADQKERSPTTCGTDQCGAFIASIDDVTLESMILGFKACASQDGPMKNFGAYADYGVDYMKMAIRNIASECGHSDKVVLAKPSPNTCAGAMSIVANFDRECPRQCKTDDDDDGSLPKCEEGQNERSSSTCGTDKCSAFIASLHDAAVESMVLGFKDCASSPATAPYAAYGENEGANVKMGIIGIAAQCGVPMPTSPPETTTMMTAVQGQADHASHDKPKWWFLTLLFCATCAAHVFAM